MFTVGRQKMILLNRDWTNISPRALGDLFPVGFVQALDIVYNPLFYLLLYFINDQVLSVDTWY